MTDEKQVPAAPEEETKKDTVRINLPAGLTGKAATPSPTAATTMRITPPKPAAGSEGTEAKKETAVMGRPAETPKPKSDTSRVQVPSAKPTVPETPRPTVRLRREPEAVAPAASVAAPTAAPVMAAGPGPVDVALAVGAMVLSIIVLAYLAMVSMG